MRFPWPFIRATSTLTYITLNANLRYALQVSRPALDDTY